MRAYTLVRAARPLVVPSSRRFLSTTPRSMAEGSTGSGSSRSGGERQGDAFTKREKAGEDLFIREQEKEKLLALKEKLKEAGKSTEELDKHIQEVNKDAGGEHN